MALYSIEDCERLDVETTHALYRDYVNSGQVDLISSFGFGRDLVDRAEGCVIHTRSGRHILDMTGGVGVLNHGHNHPRILAARKRYQANLRMEVHKNFFSPYVAGLSANIASILPEGLRVSYFANSGAEAVEGSVKMAYKYHQGTRHTILRSDISFHGKLLGAASLTASPELDFRFPEIPGVDSFTYNSIASVKERIGAHASDVYALIVEPMSGSLLEQCSESFLREVQDLCRREDIILIFDEVYTGWGKTGSLFYFMRYPGVVPDVLAMAKSFGGGKASISGYVARAGVFAKAYGNLNDATLHSTTYNGFGEETATAIEAVNIIVEDDYPARAKQIERWLLPGLQRLQAKYPTIIERINGSGALYGVFFRADYEFVRGLSKLLPSKMLNDDRFIEKLITSAVVDHLYRNHSILTFFGSNRRIPLIVSPMLITTEAEILRLVQALDDSLSRGMWRLGLTFVKNRFLKGVETLSESTQQV